MSSAAVYFLPKPLEWVSFALVACFCDYLVCANLRAVVTTCIWNLSCNGHCVWSKIHRCEGFGLLDHWHAAAVCCIWATDLHITFLELRYLNLFTVILPFSLADVLQLSFTMIKQSNLVMRSQVIDHLNPRANVAISFENKRSKFKRQLKLWLMNSWKWDPIYIQIA